MRKTEKAEKTENRVVIVGVSANTSLIVDAPKIYDGLAEGSISTVATIKIAGSDQFTIDTERPPDGVMFRLCDIPLLIENGGMYLPIDFERLRAIVAKLKLPVGLIIIDCGDDPDVSVGVNVSTDEDSADFDVVFYDSDSKNNPLPNLDESTLK